MPRGGSYDPADSGLAKYFLAMLDDADRNKVYSAGICAAIKEFQLREGRAPIVLDIGVGTGMLSGLCVHHGAKHVTGVDVNSTMVALAKESLREIDPTGKKWRVRLVEKGASQLGEAKFDMIVSEILGTLTTSESMYKYIAIYAKHLSVFGEDEGERRVYCVPRSTTQFFAVRGFSRRDLGPSLCAALEGATNSAEAARKLVPTNEGGLGLHLHLYESAEAGARIPIHVEHYNQLVPQGKDGERLGFEVTSGGQSGQPTLIDTAGLVSNDVLPLGLFEWQVELWRDAEGAPIILHNTFDAYRDMPLRNALARGSAWGFFVTALPAIVPGRPLTIKPLALNPMTKSTPQLVVGGERIGGNVCDSPMPFVSMAADKALSDTFVTALHEATKESTDSGQPPQRMLIVEDITCGGLPFAAAALGWKVDIVSEEDALTVAGREAFEAARQAAPVKMTAEAKAARRETMEGSRRLPLGSRISEEGDDCAATSDDAAQRDDHAMGEHAGMTCDRSGVCPIVGNLFHLRGEDYDLCQDEYDKLDDEEKARYECIPPPAQGSTAKADTAKAGCNWATGHVDVEPNSSRKTRSTFVPDARYHAIVFPTALLDEAVDDESTLRRRQRAEEICRHWLLADGICLPKPATVTEDTHNLDRHDFYLASLPDPILHLSGVEGALKALGAPCTKGEGGVMVPSNDAEGGLLFAGLHSIAEATKLGGAVAVEACTSVVRAEMMPGAPGLSWSVEDYRKMVGAPQKEGGNTPFSNSLRSAVARATYQGCQVRLLRIDERKRKKAKTA